MQQLALKIVKPDQHVSVLHTRGVGKVTIARKDGQKKWVQNSYNVEHLPAITRMLEGQSEVFISQNRFYGRRLITQLAELDALFTDLDYYRVEQYRQHNPYQIYGLARELLGDANLPMPNLAISTGRGVALIWLHHPVPRQALPRWTACQQQLYDVLQPLGADRQALDAARVRAAATTLAQEAARIEALFEAREDDPKSEALPAVWDSFPDFTAKAQTLKAAAEAAKDVSTQEQLQTAMRDFGATCSACHKAYRKP